MDDHIKLNSEDKKYYKNHPHKHHNDYIGCGLGFIIGVIAMNVFFLYSEWIGIVLLIIAFVVAIKGTL